MNTSLRLTFCLVMILCAFPMAMAAEGEKAGRGDEFSDSFDKKLGDGWTWLRENKENWRISDGALEIRVEPGVASNVKNALVRTAPDRSKKTWIYEVTVSNLTPPKVQFEQVGMTWYSDGRPVFKVVKELINGKLYVIPGKIPVADKPVRLRLIADAKGLTAQYLPEGEKKFKTIGSRQIAPGKNEQISLQCYNGPPKDAHWMRFEDFTITEKK